MGKLSIKRTLAILLAVLYIATLAATSVSAVPTPSGSIPSTTYSITVDSSTSTDSNGKTLAEGGHPLEFTWDFGDLGGMASTVTTQNTKVKHEYNDGINNMGTHTVCLTVKDLNTLETARSCFSKKL